MDFDHVGFKTGEVSKFVYTYSTQRLLTEIGRCDVVCANCHRMRTQARIVEGRRSDDTLLASASASQDEGGLSSLGRDVAQFG
jgi:hypothetical protein